MISLAAEPAIAAEQAPAVAAETYPDRLIYVVGAARGGTTLIKNLIGLHPGVISFDGPTHFLNHVWRHRKRLMDRLWRSVFWMPFASLRPEMRRRLDPERVRAFEREVNRALSSGSLHRIYRCYPQIVAVSPESGIEPGSTVAWLDKGNDLWGLDDLAGAFPHARFVAVLRDPRASIASLAGRLAGGREGAVQAPQPQDVVASAIYWCNLTQQQLRFAARQGGRVTLLRFEDVVLSPEPQVKALHAALGLPALSDGELGQRIGGVVYGSSLDSSEQGAGVNRRSIARWRQSLDQRSLDLIVAICGSVGRGLGYGFDPPARRLGLWSIAGMVPGGRARAVTWAKLAYLRLRTRGALASLPRGRFASLPMPPAAVPGEDR